MTSFKSALLAATVAVSAIALPSAAQAVNISFTGGVYNVMAPVRTASGSYTDTYTFTTTGMSSFSGALTTQRLRNPAPSGPIVSDLDFTTVMLMGPNNFQAAFGVPTGGTDNVELVNLTSTPLSAGTYTLTVNYAVDPASDAQGASYGGTLNLAPMAVVPEPATWATMMLGFGLVGAGLRRRRPVSVAA